MSPIRMCRLIVVFSPPLPGFYMFVDTVPDPVVMFTGDIADLYSEVFDPVDKACFTFWYHIRGTGRSRVKD